MRLFRGKGGCTACHIGRNFTDEQFHNTGVACATGVSRTKGDSPFPATHGNHGAFKTPTLRDIVRTAPYMHDGSLATLEDVVEFYSEGGHPNPGLNSQIQPRHFSPEEKRALISFLKALSGRVQEGT